jgi:hypothetical protein
VACSDLRARGFCSLLGLLVVGITTFSEGCAGPSANETVKLSSDELPQLQPDWEHSATKVSTQAIYQQRRLDLPSSKAASQHKTTRIHYGKRISLDIVRAPLTTVFQLLADAGHFNLVVDESVKGTISAKFHNVYPLIALRAIAESHGARVEQRGNIVHVVPYRAELARLHMLYEHRALVLKEETRQL